MSDGIPSARIHDEVELVAKNPPALPLDLVDHKPCNESNRVNDRHKPSDPKDCVNGEEIV